MNTAALDFSILWPAFAAGLLVTATHVPLGVQVLNRGIVFIDLAIAQIAGLGVIFADWMGIEPQGWLVQAFALLAALAGALLLTWTEKHWPEVQEAVIGVSFVLAASGALLLVASNPHGGEHLKELLVGQILWVSPGRLVIVALVYAALLGIWFTRGEQTGRMGFYLLFACAVTISVQLVGLYLVFTTLIVPALAARRVARHRLAFGYALGAVGYALGLIVSTVSDLPAGPAIVWMMTVLAIAVFALSAGRRRAAG
ncbi:MAG: metal ABC transporter permease [Burkholderiales bacterium]|nr:metal ABC transporter permease [Burkholderiales bacterium]